LARHFRDLPLALKFSLLTALILATTLGLSSGYLIDRQQQLVERQLEGKAESLGHFFALIAPETLLAYDFSTLDDYVSEVTAQKDVIFALVVDPEDRPLTTHLDSAKRLIHDAEQNSPEAMLKIREELSRHQDVLLMEFPIAHRGEALGQLSIAVDLLPSRQQTRDIAILQGGWSLGAIILLSLLIYSVFRVNVLRPVQALMNGAGRVLEGDFQQPVEHFSRDELGRLTDTFNSMMRSIHEEREELRKLSRAVEQSPASVVIADTNGVIEYVNPPFVRISGYTAEEVIGENLRILKSGQMAEEVYRELWQTLTQGEIWTGELCNRKKNGELYWENATIAPIKDDNGVTTHFIAIKEDISLRKNYEQRIFQQANFDPLTNLPNRALALDRLGQAISKAKRSDGMVALLFIDLDHFKNINDTLDHASGDALLKQVAELLAGCMRDGDTLARLGGDEFLLIIDEYDGGKVAEALSHKIMQEMARTMELQGQALRVSCSIGITLYPGDGREPGVLLKNADTAMYQAKAEGRGTYRFFSPSYNDAMVKRLQTENQLHGALERNEFQVYYQPILNARTGEVYAAEALIRWHNDELGGFVPPDRFVPLAEEIGEICDIGSFVLRQAITQMASWQKRFGVPTRIAINLSARQFGGQGIVGEVRRLLEEAELPAEGLELEITERLLLDESHGCSEQLGRLRGMGVNLSIDDFGTGYSALSYLKEYPLDTLKIDRSFVQGINASDSECNLIRAIIAMAEGLDLDVIAEGVETEEQAESLRKMGATYLQGYLFARPMPPNEFEAFLKARQAKSII
jgi:diguanylate cyclase (GGDEF)-like protein/PAS domain S-box-containing protein